MIWIIAHGDLDGLTSAAVLASALRRTRGVKPLIRTAQPFELYETIRRLTSLGLVKALFVLDVGLDEGTWGALRELLGELTSRARVAWIDHHPATLEHALDIIEAGVSLMTTLEGCTATIVGRAFLHLTEDPEFFSKLVVLGEVGDKVRQLDRNDPLYSIAETLQAALASEPTDESFKLKLVELWLERRQLIDDEVAMRAEESFEKLEKLMKEAERSLAYSSDTVLVIDLRGVRVYGHAGTIASSFAENSGRLVFLLFNVGEKDVVITCRAPSFKEVSALKAIKRIGERCGRLGGGLEKAASIKIPSHLVDVALEEIRKISEELSSQR